MGTWGTGIFDDDLALDIRDEYLDVIGDGLSMEEATKIIIERFNDEIDDPDESNVLWLCIAATQLENGNPTDIVKEKALDIIHSKSDLERWIGDPNLYSKRKEVLEQLRTMLLQH